MSIDGREDFAQTMSGWGDWTPDDIHLIGSVVLRERDEHIAAWCEKKAGEATKEADAHEEQITGRHGHLISDESHRHRALRCEGQASAFRALAAMLRGAT